MNQRIRLAIVLTLVFGIALVAFLFWQRSLIPTGAKLTREKDQIAFIKVKVGSSHGNVYVLSVTSKTVTQLTSNDRIERALWTADGENLILQNADGGYLLLNVATGELTPTNLAPTHPEVLLPNNKMLSPNRKYVVSSTAQNCCTGGRDMLKTKIFVANADGSNNRELSSGGSPAWSPDSNQIAFAAQLQGDIDTDIYIINADGSNLHRLLANPGMDSNPTWSPDGKKLFFLTMSYDSYGASANSEIFTVDADGKNLKDIGTTRAEYSYPTWSPDAQHIAYTDVKAEEVFVVKPDGSSRIKLGIGNNPVWSADGTQVAFQKGWGPTDEFICTLQQPFGFERCLRDIAQGRYPVWRP